MVPSFISISFLFRFFPFHLVSCGSALFITFTTRCKYCCFASHSCSCCFRLLLNEPSTTEQKDEAQTGRLDEEGLCSSFVLHLVRYDLLAPHFGASSFCYPHTFLSQLLSQLFCCLSWSPIVFRCHRFVPLIPHFCCSRVLTLSLSLHSCSATFHCYFSSLPRSPNLFCLLCPSSSILAPTCSYFLEQLAFLSFIRSLFPPLVLSLCYHSSFLCSCSGGSSWTRNDGWLNDSVSVCQWFGITCAPNISDTVQQISLRSNSLSGFLFLASPDFSARSSIFGFIGESAAQRKLVIVAR